MCSIAAHAMAVAAVVVVQVFASGPLPLPHRPLIFEEIRLVHLADVQPPPQGRSSRSAPAGTTTEATVPLVEPRGTTPETSLDAPAVGPGWRDGLPGVESGGVYGVESIGSVEPVRPPAISPPIPVRLHKGIVAPRKIQDVTPVYPAIARMVHAQGIVTLEAVIDARGNVSSVQVVRSSQLLDQAAIDAVRQWRYTPALLNGEPVPVIVTITVRFQMQ